MLVSRNLLSSFLLSKMSLAMFAAPIHDDDDDDDSNMVHRRKRQHNKTQKRIDSPGPKPSSEKVNNVLATIHENMASMNDDLANFEPIKPPQSIGAMRTKNTNDQRKEPVAYQNGDPMERNNQIIDRFRTIGRTPQSVQGNGSNLDMNYLDSNYIDENGAADYYNKFLPSMHKHADRQNVRFQSGYAANTAAPMSSDSHDVLMQKINYMINLLEEQQDERTGHVGEEVVLYSFLGVFMIFLVDSFVRVGKYVR